MPNSPRLPAVRLGRRALLLPLLLPLLIGSGSRMQQAKSHTPVDTSNERYVHDLTGQDKSDRLYAARTLHSRLKVAIKDAEGRPDTLRQIDAIAALDDFENIVAPACHVTLGTRNVAHHCAWILGRLAYQPALPDLTAMAAPESQAKPRARREAQEAVELMGPDSSSAP